jgi:hypothetical protein
MSIDNINKKKQGVGITGVIWSTKASGCITAVSPNTAKLSNVAARP